MLPKVLEKMGATARDREMLYKAVMQKVMFYGRESWVTTEEIMKVLEFFTILLLGVSGGRCPGTLGRRVGIGPRQKRP